MNNFLRRITTQNKPVTRKQYQYVYLRVRFFPPSLSLQYESNTFNTSASQHPVSRFKNSLNATLPVSKAFDLSKRESERSYDETGRKYNTYIYVSLSPPEYIGFEFWVWVNSMKTRPNREPFVNFRSPRSRKYFAHWYPINILRRILSLPLSVDVCAQSITIGIYRAYRSSRFRKRLNTNRARPASLESNYLEILSPSTRYACTFAIINDPDPARSLTALVDRRGKGRGGGGGGRLLSPLSILSKSNRVSRAISTFRIEDLKRFGKGGKKENFVRSAEIR